MDISRSQEQDELGTVLRALLEERTLANAHRMATDERGWDQHTWEQLAEVGVQGMAIPEAHGGAGFGHVELGVAFEEAGRVLLGAPLLSSVGLAANALLASQDDAACREYLPGIASGASVATLALTEAAGGWDECDVTVVADERHGSWTVTGDKTYVLDGFVADLVLIVARSTAGVGLFAVDGAAAGLTRTSLPTLDGTRKQAHLALRATPARLVGKDGHGWPAVAHALDVGAVLLAAEQVGGSAKVLDDAVRYAQDRQQFGRPIGSFQAVKHKCAEMLLRLEGARSAAAYALAVAAAGSAELPVAAAVAKSYCSEAFSFCAGANLQLHAGIGFTWEHTAHLYLKRAKSSESMLGSPAWHRTRLAALTGI